MNTSAHNEGNSCQLVDHILAQCLASLLKSGAYCEAWLHHYVNDNVNMNFVVPPLLKEHGCIT